MVADAGSVLRRVGLAVVPTLYILVFVNFLAFLGVSAYLGGDASSGKEEHGLYYVGNHGKYTQVSRQVFEYSALHARSVGISMPIACLVALVLSVGRNHKRRSTLSYDRRHKPGGA
jgi:hypothetical protein